MLEVLNALPKVNAYIFTYNGERIKSVKKAWKRAVERAGVPYKSFHTLRHTHGTWLYAYTKDLKLVQESLDHKNQKIPDRQKVRRPPGSNDRTGHRTPGNPSQRDRRRRLHRTAGERRPAVLTTPPLAAQRPQGERTAGSRAAANKRDHRREPRKNSRLFFPAEKTRQVTGKLRLHRVTQGYTDATRQV